MVKGLDVFRRHFDGYAGQFILIGGTAATLAMEQAGLEFRATKDLDIVLHIEALEPAFGSAFWEFVEKGGYAVKEASDTGQPVLYRFQKPEDTAYPFMLELFCRSPDGIRLTEGSQLTPIPPDEAVSSLSATLNRFLKELAADQTYSPKSLGLETPLPEIVARIALAYELTN
jgi:hypothetical protein